MLLYENNNKVTVFKHNLSSRDPGGGIDWHCDQEYAPQDDPLRNSLQSFVESVRQNRAAPHCASPEFACEVIAMLERLGAVMK